jgi:hypothetical protein
MPVPATNRAGVVIYALSMAHPAPGNKGRDGLQKRPRQSANSFARADLGRKIPTQHASTYIEHRIGGVLMRMRVMRVPVSNGVQATKREPGRLHPLDERQPCVLLRCLMTKKAMATTKKTDATATITPGVIGRSVHIALAAACALAPPYRRGRFC